MKHSNQEAVLVKKSVFLAETYSCKYFVRTYYCVKIACLMET